MKILELTDYYETQLEDRVLRKIKGKWGIEINGVRYWGAKDREDLERVMKKQPTVRIYKERY